MGEPIAVVRDEQVVSAAFLPSRERLDGCIRVLESGGCANRRASLPRFPHLRDKDLVGLLRD